MHLKIKMSTERFMCLWSATNTSIPFIQKVPFCLQNLKLEPSVLKLYRQNPQQYAGKQLTSLAKAALHGKQ